MTAPRALSKWHSCASPGTVRDQIVLRVVIQSLFPPCSRDKVNSASSGAAYWPARLAALAETLKGWSHVSACPLSLLHTWVGQDDPAAVISPTHPTRITLGGEWEKSSCPLFIFMDVWGKCTFEPREIKAKNIWRVWKPPFLQGGLIWTSLKSFEVHGKNHVDFRGPVDQAHTFQL